MKPWWQGTRLIVLKWPIPGFKKLIVKNYRRDEDLGSSWLYQLIEDLGSKARGVVRVCAAPHMVTTLHDHFTPMCIISIFITLVVTRSQHFDISNTHELIRGKNAFIYQAFGFYEVFFPENGDNLMKRGRFYIEYSKDDSFAYLFTCSFLFLWTALTKQLHKRYFWV